MCHRIHIVLWGELCMHTTSKCNAQWTKNNPTRKCDFTQVLSLTLAWVCDNVIMIITNWKPWHQAMQSYEEIATTNMWHTRVRHKRLIVFSPDNCSKIAASVILLRWFSFQETWFLCCNYKKLVIRETRLHVQVLTYFWAVLYMYMQVNLILNLLLAVHLTGNCIML